MGTAVEETVASVGIDSEHGQYLSALSVQIHEWARRKGWWDNPNRPVSEILNNFHSEVTEAWEEYRGNRMATWYAPGNAKPEGFWVEIADLVIRVADWVGSMQLPLEAMPNPGDLVAGASVSEFVESLHCQIVFIAALVASESETRDRQWINEQAAEDCSTLVAICFAYAETCGIDLRQVIELKQKYNETRPYRHGGKLA